MGREFFVPVQTLIVVFLLILSVKIIRISSCIKAGKQISILVNFGPYENNSNIGFEEIFLIFRVFLKQLNS